MRHEEEEVGGCLRGRKQEATLDAQL